MIKKYIYKKRSSGPKTPPILKNPKKVIEEEVSRVIKDYIPEFSNLLEARISTFESVVRSSLEDIMNSVEDKEKVEEGLLKEELNSVKREISTVYADVKEFTDLINKFSRRDEDTLKSSISNLNDSVSKKIESVFKGVTYLSEKYHDIEKKLLQSSSSSREDLSRLESYEKDLGKKVDDLDAWIKKASKEIYEFGSMLQVLANGTLKGQVLAINFKNGTNTTVTASPNAQTGAMDVTVNAAITGANTSTEALTATQSGNNVTLDLTALAHTFVSILFVTRQGQILNSSATDGWSRSSNTITITNAAAGDTYQVGYTY